MRSREFYEGAIAALSVLSFDIIDTGSWKASVKRITAEYRSQLTALPPAPPDPRAPRPSDPTNYSIEYCQDCHRNVEGWLIEDAAWLAVMDRKDGDNLCLSCFERRASEAGKNWCYRVAVDDRFRCDLPPDPHDEALDIKYGPAGDIIRQLADGRISVGRARELLAPRDEALKVAEAALESIHEGVCRTAQDSTCRDDERYCIGVVSRISCAALEKIKAVRG